MTDAPVDRFFGAINESTSWVSLGRIRNSFISKALTALSLAALFISKAAPTLDLLGLDATNARLTFWGSLAFLSGYILVALSAPPELRRSGELEEIVGRMTTLSDQRFFQSRLELATKLLKFQEARRRPGIPEAAVMFLRTTLAGIPQIAPGIDWTVHAPALYHADLYLRQYVKPPLRYLAGALMGAGVVVLTLPTIRGALWTLGS